MASNDKQVQLALKEKAEKALAERIATLNARNVTEASIAKDTVVRHLRADIKALNKRLAAIDALEKRKQTQAEVKAAKAAQPRVKKAKKEKVEAPAESKKKEKKEKKKEAAAAAGAPAESQG